MNIREEAKRFYKILTNTDFKSATECVFEFIKCDERRCSNEFDYDYSCMMEYVDHNVISRLYKKALSMEGKPRVEGAYLDLLAFWCLEHNIVSELYNIIEEAENELIEEEKELIELNKKRLSGFSPIYEAFNEMIMDSVNNLSVLENNESNIAGDFKGPFMRVQNETDDKTNEAPTVKEAIDKIFYGC